MKQTFLFIKKDKEAEALRIRAVHANGIEAARKAAKVGHDFELVSMARGDEPVTAMFTLMGPVTEESVFDSITRLLTVFPSFRDLVTAPAYTLSINAGKSPFGLVLANAYDAHFEAKGSPKRANVY